MGFSSRQVKQTNPHHFRIGALLVGPVLLASLNAMLELRFRSGLFLSWKFSPGAFVCVAIILWAVGTAWSRAKKSHVLIAGLFVLVATLVEVLYLSALTTLLISAGFALVGILFSIESGARGLWTLLLGLLVAYVLSVRLYNLFAFNQGSFFYLTGWTS